MEIIILIVRIMRVSWLDWKRLETNQELYRFFRKMIWFRREHPAIRSDQEPSETGFPAVSIHTDRAWDCSIDRETKALAVCYAGKTDQGEDLVYMALNVYWEEQSFELPKLPEGYEWNCFTDTALDGTGEENGEAAITEYRLHPRSAADLWVSGGTADFIRRTDYGKRSSNH